MRLLMYGNWSHHPALFQLILKMIVFKRGIYGENYTTHDAAQKFHQSESRNKQNGQKISLAPPTPMKHANDIIKSFSQHFKNMYILQ